MKHDFKPHLTVEKPMGCLQDLTWFKMQPWYCQGTTPANCSDTVGWRPGTTEIAIHLMIDIIDYLFLISSITWIVFVNQDPQLGSMNPTEVSWIKNEIN